MNRELVEIHTNLTSVLCDGEGRAAIYGSGEDLNIIDNSLRKLFDIASTRATPDITSPEMVEKVAFAIFNASSVKKNGVPCDKTIRMSFEKSAKAALQAVLEGL